jgi:peroxiredoxin Q/BCP
LKEGAEAPFFKALDQYGNECSLDDFSGKNLILYFYPKDDTPGCTTTSCNLRDEYEKLRSLNYEVVGVSADDVDSHEKFASKYSLPFSLLADTDYSIIYAYDVWGKKMNGDKVVTGIVRTTFVIDGDGIIKHVITEVNKEAHAEQILSLEKV